MSPKPESGRLRSGVTTASSCCRRLRRSKRPPPRTPPDERLTIVNAPGANAYPLINYEYAVVSKKQPGPETAAALRSFLLWAIAPDETNAQHLADAHFIPLPAHVWVLSHDQIEEIR
jgi:phosphate transport system substrate-binding protein